MTYHGELTRLLRADTRRWRLLALVRDLGLPDAWVGAGFVRAVVWDHLHGRTPVQPASDADVDVDVVWFDPSCMDQETDRALQRRLCRVGPDTDWSVKNQARMHVRNGDPPCRSTSDAVSRWPETATAVAVRRTSGDQVEILAPFGLDDLFGLLLRPTPAFAGSRAPAVWARAAAKGWFVRWPRLRAVSLPGAPGTTLRP